MRVDRPTLSSSPRRRGSEGQHVSSLADAGFRRRGSPDQVRSKGCDRSSHDRNPPLRRVELADHLRSDRRRDDRARRGAGRWRRHLLDRKPAERRRAQRAGAAQGWRAHDVTPAPFNVRTRVHEYGGGAALVHRGTVYFSHFADQRLYRLDPRRDAGAADARSRRAAPAGAMPTARSTRRAIAGSGCARRTAPSGRVDNAIVAVDLAQPGPGRVLVEGADFYAAPRRVARRQAPRLAAVEPPEHAVGRHRIMGRRVRRRRRPRRAAQDRRRRRRVGVPAAMVARRRAVSHLRPQRLVEPLSLRRAATASCGRSARTRPSSRRRNGCSASRATRSCRPGRWSAPMAKAGARCWRGSTSPAASSPRSPCPTASSARSRRRAGASSAPPARRPDRARSSSSTRRACATEVLRQSSAAAADPELQRYFTAARHLEFPTENGLTAFANYYAPHNPDFAAPAGEAPPLVVKCHGGPTSSASSSLSLGIQYWTSRGIAVIDVDYGGSTGYGRAYRERLKGRVGRRRCRRLRQRRAPCRRRGSRRSRARRSSPAAAPAAIPCWRRWPAATCSRAAPAITGFQRRRRARPRHA